MSKAKLGHVRLRPEERCDCGEPLACRCVNCIVAEYQAEQLAISDLALLEACDHRFGSLTLYGRGSVHLILEQLKSYVQEALPVPPQVHP